MPCYVYGKENIDRIAHLKSLYTQAHKDAISLCNRLLNSIEYSPLNATPVLKEPPEFSFVEKTPKLLGWDYAELPIPPIERSHFTRNYWLQGQITNVGRPHSNIIGYMIEHIVEYMSKRNMLLHRRIQMAIHLITDYDARNLLCLFLCRELAEISGQEINSELLFRVIHLQVF